MGSISTEELREFRASFARLLAAKCAESDVRRTMCADDGFDADLWHAIAELGIAALLIPEQHGGMAVGATVIEALMEEAGAALYAGPILGSAVLATRLLVESADESAKARLFPGMAAGSTIATVALTGDRGSWLLDDVEVTAVPVGNGWELTGSASFVLSANIADDLLVVAHTPEGLRCFEIALPATGVVIEPQETWDRTLRLSRIVFDGAKAAEIAGIDAAAINRVLDFGRVALAGEQAGAARRVFDQTIDYLKTRVQFGRPVGGFQALKHMAADLLVEVESATSAARAAAAALDGGAPDGEALIGLAAFACADAFVQTAASAIQMHGGIAFTWEHSAHLYLRRARADAQLLGQSDAFRDRYVTALENS